MATTQKKQVKFTYNSPLQGGSQDHAWPSMNDFLETVHVMEEPPMPTFGDLPAQIPEFIKGFLVGASVEGVKIIKREYRLDVYTGHDMGSLLRYHTASHETIQEAYDSIVTHKTAFDDYHINSGELKPAHRQILAIITEITFYGNKDSVKTQAKLLQSFHFNYEKLATPPKPKVFVNGPKKDSDFLKKKGKHYA